jgi:hypothetical protein
MLRVLEPKTIISKHVLCYKILQKCAGRKQIPDKILQKCAGKQIPDCILAYIAEFLAPPFRGKRLCELYFPCVYSLEIARRDVVLIGTQLLNTELNVRNLENSSEKTARYRPTRKQKQMHGRGVVIRTLRKDFHFKKLKFMALSNTTKLADSVYVFVTTKNRLQIWN